MTFLLDALWSDTGTRCGCNIFVLQRACFFPCVLYSLLYEELETITVMVRAHLLHPVLFRQDFKLMFILLKCSHMISVHFEALMKNCD